MSHKEEERRILALMHTYVRVFETTDVDLMESLHWVDDPRFTEIEDHIPNSFGRETFLGIVE